MKLDPRIKSVSDILTCFDIERAKEFIGQIGYFTDDLYRFANLRYCDYGTLADVRDGHPGGVFHGRDADFYRWFFLPESSLKPEGKKKWRPFTLNEFRAKFPLLSPVTFRRNNNGELRTYSFIGYIADGTIILGNDWHKLDNLFEVYEIQDEDGSWTPFGVEE